jgi:hypothetical protein
MTKIYVLESWDYEEHETVGVFSSFEAAEQTRLFLGHTHCDVREYEVKTEMSSDFVVYLTVYHTKKSDGTWEEWRAYTTQPTKHYNEVELNKVQYWSDETGSKLAPGTIFFSECWQVTSTSMALGIELLREALGERYTKEIDSQLREDML